jgi:hypothetical protein
LTKIRRHFWTDKTKILNMLRKLDDSDIIDVTSKALGSVLPEHKKLPANLSLEQDDFLSKQKTGENRAFELQEIVVSNGVIGRGGSLANKPSADSPKDMQTMSASIQLLERMHLSITADFKLDQDTQLNQKRDEILNTAIAFDNEDAKLAKRREEKAAARAALKQRVPGAAASASLAHADAQNATSEAWAAGDGLGSPPPFDEEDAKLAKRREEKAAARAALKQRSPHAISKQC